MINLDNKKWLLIFANIVAVAIIGHFLFKSPSQHRGIASVAEKNQSSILDTAKLSWEYNQSGITMKLEGKEKNICDDWSNLRVVFKGEGLAYSGEVDRVLQSSNCENGKFLQSWVSHLSNARGDEYHKSGTFGEEPPMWVLEEMSVLGPQGYLFLNAEEIRQHYHLVPTLVPQ